MVGDVPIIGTTGQIPELIDQYDVDEVIIALPEASHRELVQLISKCQRGRVSIKVYPDIFAYMAGGLTRGRSERHAAAHRARCGAARLEAQPQARHGHDRLVFRAGDAQSRSSC